MLSNKKINILAGLILVIMFVLMLSSVFSDSATMDELAHLPAGYSYITQKDMRLNPEHPPLMKDLAGLSVFLWSGITQTEINFPASHKSWQEDINGQWDFGREFLYRSGNDADKILFWGRFPLMLLALVFGFFIFKWAKEIFGEKTAILSLFLYSFSPTILAHSRLVTTDVPAAFGFFIGLYYFIRYLKNPTAGNLIKAGIAFGIAQLMKFSLILLAPLFVVLIILWGIIQLKEKFLFSALKNFGGLVLIGLISLVLIYSVYIEHIWNYPAQRQTSDTIFILTSYGGEPDKIPFDSCKSLNQIKRCPAEITIWLTKKPLLRPLAQYFYGMLMVLQRAAGGNTTYFLGEISAAGWWYYFPVVYLIKEPLLIHILIILALLSLFLIKRRQLSSAPSLLSRPLALGWRAKLQKNFPQLTMLLFIVFYWYTSITSPLNIGVRHVLPTFPFIYILISSQFMKLHGQARGISLLRVSPTGLPVERNPAPKTIHPVRNSVSNGVHPLVNLWFSGVWMKFSDYLKNFYPTVIARNEATKQSLSFLTRLFCSFQSLAMAFSNSGKKIIYWFLIIGLIGWYGLTNISVFPHYLSYFNEIANRPKNGYKYVVDSNLDWGQDLKRLSQWVKQNNVNQIYIDYFGGSDPQYYLGEKFRPWHSSKNPSELKSGDFLAVSATFLQGGRGKAAKGFNEPTGQYQWLNNYKPAAIIGNSVFVYQIP